MQLTVLFTASLLAGLQVVAAPTNMRFRPECAALAPAGHEIGASSANRKVNPKGWIEYDHCVSSFPPEPIMPGTPLPPVISSRAGVKKGLVVPHLKPHLNPFPKSLVKPLVKPTGVTKSVIEPRAPQEAIKQHEVELEDEEDEDDPNYVEVAYEAGQPDMDTTKKILEQNSEYRLKQAEVEGAKAAGNPIPYPTYTITSPKVTAVVINKYQGE
ncbi:hypothetical protein NA57DRAFT_73655 [Rhizodiscina lignyota]|uniref:Uncharacterized protein n=1 Tax=Rhizodiscina lignyota TaxID=1504668 RepID=A0A9P4M904_9PEZI|nr:hypothetical protein NA57DRAFT_73655 [Rhizodiscina lignyota]